MTDRKQAFEHIAIRLEAKASMPYTSPLQARLYRQRAAKYRRWAQEGLLQETSKVKVFMQGAASAFNLFPRSK